MDTNSNSDRAKKYDLDSVIQGRETASRGAVDAEAAEAAKAVGLASAVEATSEQGSVKPLEASSRAASLGVGVGMGTGTSMLLVHGILPPPTPVAPPAPPFPPTPVAPPALTVSRQNPVISDIVPSPDQGHGHGHGLNDSQGQCNGGAREATGRKVTRAGSGRHLL
jgi:hypothetical protein